MTINLIYKPSRCTGTELSDILSRLTSILESAELNQNMVLMIELKKIRLQLETLTDEHITDSDIASEDFR